MTKKIKGQDIKETIKKALIKMNYEVGEDVICAFNQGKERETAALSKAVLSDLLKNAELAKTNKIPICQDTGMVVAFIEIGQDISLDEGSLTDWINLGVKEAYEEGYLRKSVVESPLNRKNTRDNTPAVVHYDLVPGSKLRILIGAKGFGSENMSQTKMLNPSEGIKGVVDFIIKVVKESGSNPCPPIVVGVGIGGTLEKACLMAKKQLFRSIGSKNQEADLAKLEAEILEKVNALNIGPQGLGGVTTALAVHIETFPTHIAGLPVCVNINCHVARHEEIIL